MVLVAIALAAFLADLGTKQLVLAVLEPGHPIEILDGLVTFTLLRNPGAAFSLGENLTVVFTFFSFAALIFVTFWLVPKVRQWGWVVVAGLLWAGIAGNLVDRLFREPSAFVGEVIDFIQLPYFAVFNVADICISFSAVIIIYLYAIKQVGINGESLKGLDSQVADFSHPMEAKPANLTDMKVTDFHHPTVAAPVGEADMKVTDFPSPIAAEPAGSADIKVADFSNSAIASSVRESDTKTANEPTGQVQKS